MNPLRSLQHQRSPPAFCNIRKFNLCSKTEISKTAWINAGFFERDLATAISVAVFMKKTYNYVLVVLWPKSRKGTF